MSFLPPPWEWMTGRCQELTLDEALRDPLIKAVMKADGVDPRELESDLRRTALEIEWQRLEPEPVQERCAPWC